MIITCDTCQVAYDSENDHICPVVNAPEVHPDLLKAAEILEKKAIKAQTLLDSDTLSAYGIDMNKMRVELYSTTAKALRGEE